MISPWKRNLFVPAFLLWDFNDFLLMNEEKMPRKKDVESSQLSIVEIADSLTIRVMNIVYDCWNSNGQIVK